MGEKGGVRFRWVAVEVRDEGCWGSGENGNSIFPKGYKSTI
jgi:hypothetical protein